MATAIASSSTPSPQLDTRSASSSSSTTTAEMSNRQSAHSSQPSRRTSAQRPSSYAKNRMSTYSSASQRRSSRPVSHALPKFQSSLPYAFVRDFAYPSNHPLHYGPPPKDSTVSTPASESRPLSDPPSWNPSHSSWPAPNWNPEAMYSQQQLPAMAFGDGPPYSEDEDLHSPVVTTSRRRKHRSDQLGPGRSPGVQGRAGGAQHESDRGIFIGVNSDGSETYFSKDANAGEDGPGGEYVTYPPNEARHAYLSPGSFGQEDVPFDPGFEFDSDDEIAGEEDPSRYSRDYQFTIVSPDEEMHGKAVALFDFTREHENELPLTEGQVILVSYRHGQGWLVAEDPKSGESGLVPEEFVRLVRDIEGGLNGLNGDLHTAMEIDDAPGPDVEANPSENHSNFSAPESATPEQPKAGSGAENDAMNDDDENNNNNTAAANSEEQRGDSRPAKEEETKEETADSTKSNSTSGQNNDHGTEKPIEKKGNNTKNPAAVVSTFSTSSRDLSPYPQHLLTGHQHSRSTPPQLEQQSGGRHLSRSGSNSSHRPKSIAKRSALSKSESQLGS